MGIYELGNELDRSTPKKKRKQMQEGTIESWLEESHALAKRIYTSANAGEKLGYSYAYTYNPMVFEQLKKGGFRLAKVLNAFFLKGDPRKAFAPSLSFNDPEGQINEFPNSFCGLGYLMLPKMLGFPFHEQQTSIFQQYFVF